ncbi:MAG TPA: hypothetical protein PLM25_09990 [Limnochordia bacterium]|nr:hypothetical protein [Limnochordia bacterium]
MLWGVTTMTFYHRPILEAVEFIGSCGFDCVEIWADHAWDEKKGASAAKLKGALARWGIAVHRALPRFGCEHRQPQSGH